MTEVHEYHLQCVQHNKENAALYGVHSTCSFDALGYFDVTKSLPPDIMHDMLEGVFPLTLKHVICKAHIQKHEKNSLLVRMTRSISLCCCLNDLFKPQGS